MAGYATVRPSQRWGLNTNPQVGMIAAANATAWLDGAALTVTTANGNLVELLNAGAANTLWGIASSPFTTTPTFNTALGTETQTAVGAGSAITGVRRYFYPNIPGMLFIGSIDTSGSQGATALAKTDIGKTTSPFTFQSVNAAGALTDHNFWIIDRTAGGNFPVVITRLIDPPGAKFGDTPVPGVNSGQALVEFYFVQSTRPY